MENIDNIIASQNADEVISLLKSGRRHPQPQLRKINSEVNPYEHVINDKVLRPDRRVVTDAIDPNTGETTEETQVHYEKVARISLSYQKLIVNRAVSFMFGNDVEISADTKEDEAQNNVLLAIKSVMSDIDSRSHNRALAREVFTYTEAAEMWYVVKENTTHKKYGFETPYRIKTMLIKPSEGDKLYPYFDRERNLVSFSREFYTYEGVNSERHNYFETFTSKYHYLWEQTTEGWQLVDNYPEIISFGKIPIVYVTQPNTEWNDVQPLIDRMEHLLSNFADTNDYHASPKIIVKGGIRSWAKKGEQGAIIECDQDASIDYLTWSQAPESIKLEIDTLRNQIFTNTQTPDIAFDTLKSIQAPSGIALKFLFMDAHLKVQDKREYFDKALKRRMNIVKALLEQIALDETFRKACHDIDIEIDITPYLIQDEQSLMNLLQSGTGNKPIVSRKTAVQSLGWVKDTMTELKQIEEEEAASVSMGDITKQFL